MERKIEDMTLRLTPASLAYIGNRYVNEQMDIFHIKMAKKFTKANLDTMTERGMKGMVGKNFWIDVFPPRAFDKDRDIQPFMHIPAITICLN